MSWLSDNLPGVLATVGGGALTAFGGGAVGIPMMAGGLTYMGGQSTNQTNRQIATDATQSNIQQAQAQMNFQAQMSNTANQRNQADLRAAGLNPALAGINQQGASTPSGAAGKAETTKVENTLGQAVSSAVSMKQLMTQIDQTESQKMLNSAMATKALQETHTSASSAKQMETNTQAVQSQLKAIAAKAQADEKKSKYDSDAAGYDAIMSRFGRESGTAKNLTDMATPLGWFKRGTKIDPDKMFYGHKSTGEILNP